MPTEDLQSSKGWYLELGDILVILGAAITSVGLGLIYWPAVLVFIGAVLLIIGLLRSR